MEHAVLWLQIRCNLLKQSLRSPSWSLSTYSAKDNYFHYLEVRDIYTLKQFIIESKIMDKASQAKETSERPKRGTYNGLFLLEADTALILKCSRASSTSTSSPVLSSLVSTVLCSTERNDALSLFLPSLVLI